MVVLRWGRDVKEEGYPALREYLVMSADIFGCCNWGEKILLTSSEYMPGTTLGILQGTV